ncbi:MAG TPA: hypothetical protein VKV05_06350 [Terriglobales bacterium]|nr:hypothetical protein [Terriglobales bacterium]
MVSKSVYFLVLSACLLSLAATPRSLSAGQESAKAQNSGDDISGMYTFLREGEFLQVTVEDGKLSGYVSRFGDSDSDKGQFIDQFFDKTSLDGNRLSFNTQTVHGVWYDFKGTVTAPAGRKPSDEGYHVIKGTLVEHATDAKGAEKTMQRQVEFKSFPADVNQP